MERDLDLVRAILKEAEKSERAINIQELVCDAYSLEQIGYHVELMQAHGLVDATIKKAWGGDIVAGLINGLTWEGHDYLDAIRSATVWEKTKQAIRNTVGSTSLDVVKQTASTISLQLIKTGLGL